MIVNVVEVVGMFLIMSRSQKCKEMSMISRMVNVGTGTNKFYSDVIIRCVIVCRCMTSVFTFSDNFGNSYLVFQVSDWRSI